MFVFYNVYHGVTKKKEIFSLPEKKMSVTIIQKNRMGKYKWEKIQKQTAITHTFTETSLQA